MFYIHFNLYKSYRGINIFCMLPLSSWDRFLMDNQVHIDFQITHMKLDIMYMNWDYRIFYKCWSNRCKLDLVHMFHLGMNRNISLCMIFAIINMICNMLSLYNHSNLMDRLCTGPKHHFYRTQWDIISSIFFRINKIQKHIVSNYLAHSYKQHMLGYIFYNFYHQ